jgi:hypothetical protein
MKCVAIIIDIKDSRNKSDFARLEIQNRLEKSRIFINKYYPQNKIISGLVFSSGDSIQGLVSDLQTAIEIFNWISSIMSEAELWCGIAMGDVNDILLDIWRGDSNYLDGTVYHKAIDAINYSKKKRQKITIITDEENQINDFLISLLLNNIFNIEKNKKNNILNLINILTPIPPYSLECFNDYVELVGICIQEKISIYHNNKYKNLPINIDSKETPSINQISTILFKYKYDIFNEQLINEKNINRFPKYIKNILIELFGTSRQNIERILNDEDIYNYKKTLLGLIMFINSFNKNEDKPKCIS